MVKNSFLLLFLCFFSFLLINENISAQYSNSYYLVSFNNKNNSSYSLSNPSAYLSEKSIYRRLIAKIHIDSTDLPVNKRNLDSLLNYGATINYTSKWLNAALVFIDDSTKLEAIYKSSVVNKVQFLAPRLTTKKSSTKQYKLKARKSSDSFDYDNLAIAAETYHRIRMIELNQLIKIGNTGQDIQIAVFDNGFKNANKLDAFSHLFNNGQILGFKNFTTGGQDVFNSGTHGTYVLSTMGAYVENLFTGSAIGADYYLFQTEDNRYELPIEEVNWLIAAEYADSLGVNIITSSLGYTTYDSAQYNHNQSELDGKTAIVSKAASFASAKGILVFNSAGNSGKKPWHKISFPADARNILAVGSINKDYETSSFSSFGYSADGRIKPDITAIGEKAALISYLGDLIRGNGTSFSNPFMAGAAASLMSATNNTNAKQIRNAIIQSSHQYLNPDSTQGYGIPNVYLAALLLNNETIPYIIDKQDFVVAPNPFQDEFHILFNATQNTKVDIEIFDISGRLIYQKSSVQISQGENFYSIEDLHSSYQGLCFVSIIIEGNRITKKIVKY
ncbi:MAG: hypothetical protein DRI86_03750 [Bacteroidetes bacterium]|nr:MAG: hypothetical protein DRI86_03750 [Bacteroidota bacterium]